MKPSSVLSFYLEYSTKFSLQRTQNLTEVLSIACNLGDRPGYCGNGLLSSYGNLKFEASFSLLTSGNCILVIFFLNWNLLGFFVLLTKHIKDFLWYRITKPRTLFLLWNENFPNKRPLFKIGDKGHSPSVSSGYVSRLSKAPGNTVFHYLRGRCLHILGCMIKYMVKKELQ